MEARARMSPDGVGIPWGILEWSMDEMSKAAASGDVSGR